MTAPAPLAPLPPLTGDEGTPMSEPLPITPLFSTPRTEEERRARWLKAMSTELEAARYTLVNLPDSEGPESLDDAQRRADDLLTDAVHAEAAAARAALRRALDLIHGYVST